MRWGVTNPHSEASRGSEEGYKFHLVFVLVKYVEIGARRAQIATAQGIALGLDWKNNRQPEEAAIAFNPTHIFRHRLYDIFSEKRHIHLEMREFYDGLFAFGYISVSLHMPIDL